MFQCQNLPRFQLESSYKMKGLLINGRNIKTFNEEEEELKNNKIQVENFVRY